MTRRLAGAVTALVLCAVSGTPSDARQGNTHSQLHYQRDQHGVGAASYLPVYQQKLYPGPGKYKKAKVKKRCKRAIGPSARSRPQSAKHVSSSNIFRRYYDALPGSVSLNGLVPELASLARTLAAVCGSKIISAVRHTYVRGSGKLSLHASGRAIDVSGNPSCIARMTASWPGGVSNDYFKIRPNHYHISYSPGGREWGSRFAHYSGRNRARYAKRWKRRYAHAS